MYGELNQRVYLPRFVLWQWHRICSSRGSELLLCISLLGRPADRAARRWCRSSRRRMLLQMVYSLLHLLPIVRSIHTLKKAQHGEWMRVAPSVRVLVESSKNSAEAWLNSCTNVKIIPIYGLVEVIVVVR